MKLAVWNMCNKANQEQAKTQILDYFGAGYDAVALQEVPYAPTGQPLTNDIASESGLHQNFIHTRGLSRRGERLVGYGTAILSTSPLIDVHHATIRSDRWSYMTSGDGNQRVAVAFSDRSNPDIRIAVSHLSYRLVGGIGSVGMRQERTNLYRFLAEQHSRGELIFAGDMNCKPETELDIGLADIGLVSVVPNYDADSGYTYQSRYPGLGSIRANLDRVYASSKVTPQVRLGNFGVSDHRPLEIEL